MTIGGAFLCHVGITWPFLQTPPSESYSRGFQNGDVTFTPHCGQEDALSKALWPLSDVISMWNWKMKTVKICQSGIPSRFPTSRLPTKGAICRWVILTSRDINIAHPNYIMLLCSKLIWVVFGGHKICFQKCSTYKEPIWSFEKNINRPDFPCSASKRSPSILMKRRK